MVGRLTALFSLLLSNHFCLKENKTIGVSLALNFCLMHILMISVYVYWSNHFCLKENKTIGVSLGSFPSVYTLGIGGLASRIENQDAIDIAVVGMLADPKDDISLVVVIRLNIAESKLAIDHVVCFCNPILPIIRLIIYAIITINQRDMTMKIRSKLFRHKERIMTLLTLLEICLLVILTCLMPKFVSAMKSQHLLGKLEEICCMVLDTEMIRVVKTEDPNDASGVVSAVITNAGVASYITGEALLLHRA
ncbi:hypothetical protein ACJX0J_022671, partial [Zea mays]